MKPYYKILILIIILSLFNCKKDIVIQENQKVSVFDYDNIQFNNKLKFTNHTFSGETEITKDKHAESGQYAKYLDGEISPYKIGIWKEFYENGKLKSEGKYLIGRYVQCCLTGHCLRYYNYKVGNWKHYFPNGTLKLNGNYSLKKLAIETNCGGDFIKYGILDSDAKYYDDKGNRLKENTEKLKLNYEKEYTHTYPKMYLIPDPENDNIILTEFDK